MRRQLPVLVLISLFVLLVVAPTLQGKRYAFRDVSHFYLPLFDYIDQRCATEWLPLWNPLDQCGMPLIGESSTAVLYPIRWLVYSMPIQNELAMNLYLAVHLLIASVGAGWLARRNRCSLTSVAACGLIYPLSGSVFALYCNPPFLVGAAWLPWALGIFLNRRQGWSFHTIRYGAIVLAMMVLGGDPQSALHVVLIATGQLAIILLGRWKRRRCTLRWAWGSLATIFVSAVLAGGLACIQVVASVDWSIQSERVALSEGRNDQYHFSLPPWHVAEILTPYPFGRPFPNNAYLARLIPGEGRMWTPTIYQGGITALALICGLFQFGKLSGGERRWLILAILALLLCFGHFGLAWLLQQTPGLLNETSSAVGGAYWWLSKLIPGYESFRYPVKWLPVFSIAAAVCTALWLDRIREAWDWKAPAMLLGILLVAPLCFSFWAHWHSPLSIRPADEYWGPIETDGARSIIVMSCLFSAAVIALIGFLGNRYRGESFQLAKVAIVVVTACEIGWVAHGILPLVEIQDELRYTQELEDQYSLDTVAGTRHLRTQSGAWPAVWQSSHSARRALEVAVSERASWFGRWHLANRQAVFNSMASIRHHQIARFWNATNRINRELENEDRQIYWSNLRRWLAIGGDVHCDGANSQQVDDLKLIRVTHGNRREAPLFRLHEQWNSTDSLEVFLNQMAKRKDVPMPHINTDQRSSATASSQRISSLKIIDDVRISVRCEETCLVERVQLQDGNWNAEITPLQGNAPTQTLEVHACSYLNQAVFVPPGEWELRFYYAPWWKWPAFITTCLSVLMLVLPFRRPVR